MAIENILSQIDSEISRLQQARALLTNIGAVATKSARPAKVKTGKKRILSAEARKRIADAQRRRWAAVRAKAKQKV